MNVYSPTITQPKPDVNQLYIGDTTQLTWSSDDVASCSLYSADGSLIQANVLANDQGVYSCEVKPNKSTTYYVAGYDVNNNFLVDSTRVEISVYYQANTLNFPSNAIGSGGPIVITTDGAYLYTVAGTNNNEIYKVATNNNSKEKIITSVGQVAALLLSPNNTTLYVVCANVSANVGSVQIFNTADYSLKATIGIGQSPHNGAVLKPDGSKLFVLNCGSTEYMGNVSVIDTSSYQALASLTTFYANENIDAYFHQRPVTMAMNPSGTRLAVAYIAGAGIGPAPSNDPQYFMYQNFIIEGYDTDSLALVSHIGCGEPDINLNTIYRLDILLYYESDNILRAISNVGEQSPVTCVFDTSEDITDPDFPPAAGGLAMTPTPISIPTGMYGMYFANPKLYFGGQDNTLQVVDTSKSWQDTKSMVSTAIVNKGTLQYLINHPVNKNKLVASITSLGIATLYCNDELIPAAVTLQKSAKLNKSEEDELKN
ncbi:hypothetical protein BH10PSE19_BH10PSE19_00770 [soil metagenome]